MALPINVNDLIHQRKVERTRIEYKEDWNPEPIIHTITAFANDFDNMGGGYILIGVEEENGRPRPTFRTGKIMILKSWGSQQKPQSFCIPERSMHPF